MNPQHSYQRLTIDGSRLVFGGVEVDLTDHPVTAKVFKIFLEDPLNPIEKDVIVEKLYPVPSNDHSLRFSRSRRHNAIKMISRARRIAQNYFDPQGEGLLEWFPYDNRQRRWRLSRFAPDILERRLSDLQ